MAFSVPHVCRLTVASTAGAGITLHRLVSLKFRASGHTIQFIHKLELTFERGKKTTLARRAQAVHLGSLWVILSPHEGRGEEGLG